MELSTLQVWIFIVIATLVFLSGLCWCFCCGTCGQSLYSFIIHLDFYVSIIMLLEMYKRVNMMALYQVGRNFMYSILPARFSRSRQWKYHAPPLQNIDDDNENDNSNTFIIMENHS